MLLDLSEDLKKFKLTNYDVGRVVYIGMTGKATMCSGRRRQCMMCGKFIPPTNMVSVCCGSQTMGASYRQLGKIQSVSPDTWVFIDGYIEHSVYQPAVQRVRPVITLPRPSKPGP